MLREWLKEQWENIRYAHKSVWVSMLFFISLATCIVWYAVDYSYSSQLAEKNAAITNLSAQIKQMQQQNSKASPQTSQPDNRNPKDSNNAISDVKEHVQEKINDINNEANVLRYRYR